MMIELKQKYDATKVAVMRQAWNEVVTDRRFLVPKSVTQLEAYPSDGGVGCARPRPPKNLCIREAGCSCLTRAGAARMAVGCPRVAQSMAGVGRRIARYMLVAGS